MGLVKLGIPDGEVPGITLRAADMRKLWDYELSGPVSSGGSFKGVGYGNIEDGSEELE